MKTLLILFTLLVANAALADTVGVRVSAGMWSYEPTGDIRNSSIESNTFNLKSDLGMNDDETFQGFLYIEHPVPLLPNLRLGVTDLKLTGNGTTSGQTWNGTPIPAGNVATDADLSHTDIGLYYQVWDTGFDFDLGVNAKLFDGTVTLTGDSGPPATSSFNETIPMLYLHLGIPLVAGFSIAGDLSASGYQGNNFNDTLIRVRWDSDYVVGVELGYRSMLIDYSDGDEFADVKIKGPYLNATLKF